LTSNDPTLGRPHCTWHAHRRSHAHSLTANRLLNGPKVKCESSADRCQGRCGALPRTSAETFRYPVRGDRTSTSGSGATRRPRWIGRHIISNLSASRSPPAPTSKRSAAESSSRTTPPRPHFIIVDGCRTVSHVLLLFCRSIVTGQHAPTLPNGLKDSTAPVELKWPLVCSATTIPRLTNLC